MTDDLKRITEDGDEVGRWLIRSKQEDVPPHDLHARIWQAMQSGEMPGERAVPSVIPELSAQRRARFGLIAVGAAVLAVAAALVLMRARTTEKPQAQNPAPSTNAVAAPASSPSAASQANVTFPPCRQPVVLSGKQLLLDDFEEPTPRVWLEGGLSGVWEMYSDRSGEKPPPNGPVHPTRLAPRRAQSRHALHMTGGALSGWGLVVGLYMDERRCLDLSKFAGVEFWTRGKGKLFFALKTAQTNSVETGGTCTSNCFDSYGKSITLAPEWQRYRLTWGELAQRGFGTKVPLDLHSAMSFEFALGAEDTPYDFWIDDVALLPVP